MPDPKDTGDSVRDKIHHDLSDLAAAARRVGDVLYDAGGQAIGYLELGGLRYPVKHYQAPVDQRLHRGARLEECGMEELVKAGFRGVVNLCMENDDDAAPAARFGIAALHIPILDNASPTLEQVQQFLDFVRSHPPTYVHCEQGKGRTGTMCAVWRMVEDGWKVDEAIGEAQRFGLEMPNQIAFLRTIPSAVTDGRLR